MNDRFVFSKYFMGHEHNLSLPKIFKQFILNVIRVLLELIIIKIKREALFLQKPLFKLK